MAAERLVCFSRCSTAPYPCSLPQCHNFEQSDQTLLKLRGYSRVLPAQSSWRVSRQSNREDISRDTASMSRCALRTVRTKPLILRDKPVTEPRMPAQAAVTERGSMVSSPGLRCLSSRLAYSGCRRIPERGLPERMIGCAIFAMMDEIILRRGFSYETLELNLVHASL